MPGIQVVPVNQDLVPTRNSPDTSRGSNTSRSMARVRASSFRQWERAKVSPTLSVKCSTIGPGGTTCLLM